MNQNVQNIHERLNLQTMDVRDLLLTHAALIEELRNRKIIRSSNNPVADYTEWLVSSTLKLSLVGKSSAGFDAFDGAENKVQIKGRRRTSHNQSTQLGSIRNLESKPFHYLIGVIYNEDFSIDYVAKVPHEVVVEKSKYRSHTNSNILDLRRTILDR
ncbi:MAG: hypothetical protein U0Z26_18625 [Anaerolineales bacterium]